MTLLKRLDPDPTFEVIRNYPLRQPVLWSMPDLVSRENRVGAALALIAAIALIAVAGEARAAEVRRLLFGKTRRRGRGQDRAAQRPGHECRGHRLWSP